jgi:ribonuclease BN (tRNA processing enzyme)
MGLPMNLTVLGTGGFLNEGLPGHSLLIDGHLLVDVPPDILQSLARESVDLGAIDTIVLSHLHGDHCFGLPFFLFNRFVRQAGKPALPLKLFGPAGSMARLKLLLELAISPEHPYVGWSLSSIEFVEIAEGMRLPAAGGLELEFARADHEPETYSLLVYIGSEKVPRLVSSSDTRWGAGMEELSGRDCLLFLCDSCGGGEDGGVHMGFGEIRTRLLPRLGKDTEFLATHYSVLPATDPGFGFARPGQKISLAAKAPRR